MNYVISIVNQLMVYFRLRSAEETLNSYRKRVGLVDDYERTIRRLRDDVAILSGTRKALIIDG